MRELVNVCQGCRALDDYLARRTDQMPCMVCDRLWSRATISVRGQRAGRSYQQSAVSDRRSADSGELKAEHG